MYVVCIECGEEMAYDWEQMKVIQTSGMKRCGRSTKSAIENF